MIVILKFYLFIGYMCCFQMINNLYISKSWQYAFITPLQRPHHPFISDIFSHLIITLLQYFSLIFTYFFIISTLLFSLYLNFTILPSLYLPFILNLLLPILFTIKICYILFHSIHILPTQKGKYSLSLSLSLSLSHSRVLILYCIFALG